MKKALILLVLAVLALAPVAMVKADEENPANKPAYTKRFVMHSCQAFHNSERNAKNIRNLEKVSSQLTKQIANLKIVLAKQTATSSAASTTQALINKRTAEKTELDAHIAALKGTADPVFCYDIYKKENDREIAKNERLAANEAKKAANLKTQQAKYNAKMAEQARKTEAQMAAVRMEMENTADARKKAAKEKQLSALQKRTDNLTAQIAKYNANMNAQTAKTTTKADGLLASINELKQENQKYQAGMQVRAAAQGMDNQMAGTTSANTAASANIAVDSDGDGLPDAMEKNYGTDPNKWDTDGDGFSDGEEVKNGYNPLGEGRMGDARINS